MATITLTDDEVMQVLQALQCHAERFEELADKADNSYVAKTSRDHAESIMDLNVEIVRQTEKPLD